MTLAHPLQWPAGRPRTPELDRQESTFKVSLAEARDHLYLELERLGASQVTVSSNAVLNLNGSIAYRQPHPRTIDPGVAVYFTRKGVESCVACDRYDTIRENVRAIGLTLEALRGIARWGTTQMVDAAFTGFAAIPAKLGDGRAWWIELGVPLSSSPETIHAAYIHKAKQLHPDLAGGDEEAFKNLTLARDEGLRKFGVAGLYGTGVR